MGNEKKIRLIKVAKEFNVGLNTITDFLHRKGIEVDSSPNAPIDADTYAILEKYNYQPPFPSSISGYNKFLKELLQHVGFKELIKRETKVNGVVEVTYEPKWKLISSHTARRTFATNNLVRGLKTSEIRRATGHKSESAFEKYICYFDE